MSVDERAIRELIDTWMAETISGNGAAVLEIMADDAVFLTPGKPPFGKKEFAAAQAGMKGASVDGKVSVKEVKTFGNWGFAWSHLDVSIKPADGTTTVRRSGNALTVFQRLPNDRWVLARDANLLTEQ